MQDKYGLENLNIDRFKSEWIETVCDYIRETEVPLFYNRIPSSYNYDPVHGYVITKNGVFGIITRYGPSAFKIVISNHFALCLTNSLKYINIHEHNHDNEIFVESIPIVNDVPDFDDISKKIKRQFNPIYKIYFNAVVNISKSTPPVGWALSHGEWIEAEQLLNKIKVTMELE